MSSRRAGVAWVWSTGWHEPLGALAVDEVAAAVEHEVEHGRPGSVLKVVEADLVADDEVAGVGGDVEDPASAYAAPELPVGVEAATVSLEFWGQHLPGDVGIRRQGGNVVADEGLHPARGGLGRHGILAWCGVLAGRGVRWARRGGVRGRVGCWLRVVGQGGVQQQGQHERCLLYTSPSPRDGLLSRMPSSA